MGMDDLQKQLFSQTASDVNNTNFIHSDFSLRQLEQIDIQNWHTKRAEEVDSEYRQKLQVELDNLRNLNSKIFKDRDDFNKTERIISELLNEKSRGLKEDFKLQQQVYQEKQQNALLSTKIKYLELQIANMSLQKSQSCTNVVNYLTALNTKELSALLKSASVKLHNLISPLDINNYFHTLSVEEKEQLFVYLQNVENDGESSDSCFNSFPVFDKIESSDPFNSNMLPILDVNAEYDQCSIECKSNASVNTSLNEYSMSSDEVIDYLNSNVVPLDSIYQTLDTLSVTKLKDICVYVLKELPRPSDVAHVLRQLPACYRKQVTEFNACHSTNRNVLYSESSTLHSLHSLESDSFTPAIKAPAAEYEIPGFLNLKSVAVDTCDLIPKISAIERLYLPSDNFDEEILSSLVSLTKTVEELSHPYLSPSADDTAITNLLFGVYNYFSAEKSSKSRLKQIVRQLLAQCNDANKENVIKNDIATEIGLLESQTTANNYKQLSESDSCLQMKENVDCANCIDYRVNISQKIELIHQLSERRDREKQEWCKMIDLLREDKNQLVNDRETLARANDQLLQTLSHIVRNNIDTTKLINKRLGPKSSSRASSRQFSRCASPELVTIPTNSRSYRNVSEVADWSDESLGSVSECASDNEDGMDVLQRQLSESMGHGSKISGSIHDDLVIGTSENLKSSVRRLLSTIGDSKPDDSPNKAELSKVLNDKITDLMSTNSALRDDLNELVKAHKQQLEENKHLHADGRDLNAEYVNYVHSAEKVLQERLESTETYYRTQIKQLESAFTTLQASHVEYVKVSDAELEDSRLRIVHLEKKLNSNKLFIEEKLCAKQQKIDALTTEFSPFAMEVLNERTKLIQTLKAEIKQLESKHKSVIDNFETLKLQFESESKEANSRCVKYLSDIETISLKHTELEKLNEAHSVKINQLQSELESRSKSLLELESQNSLIESQKNSFIKRVDALEQQKVNLQTELSSLGTHIQNITADGESIKQKLRHETDQVEKLISKNAEVNIEMGKMLKENVKLLKENEATHNQIIACRASLQKCASIIEQDFASYELSKECSNIDEYASLFTGSIQSLLAHLKSSHFTEVCSLEKAIEERNNCVIGKDHLIEQLQTKLNDYQALLDENKQLSRAKNECNEKINKLEIERFQLIEQLGELTERIESSKDENEMLVKDLKSSQSSWAGKVKSTLIQMENVEEENKKLFIDVQKYEVELKATQDRVNILNNTIENQKESLKLVPELRAQLDELQFENEILLARFEECKFELETLTNEFSQQSDKLEKQTSILQEVQEEKLSALDQVESLRNLVNETEAKHSAQYAKAEKLDMLLKEKDMELEDLKTAASQSDLKSTQLQEAIIKLTEAERNFQALSDETELLRRHTIENNYKYEKSALECKRLKLQLEDSNVRYAALEKNLEDLKVIINEVEDRNKHSAEECKSLKSLLNAQKTDSEKLRSESEKQALVLAEYETNYRMLVADIDRISLILLEDEGAHSKMDTALLGESLIHNGKMIELLHLIQKKLIDSSPVRSIIGNYPPKEVRRSSQPYSQSAILDAISPAIFYDKQYGHQASLPDIEILSPPPIEIQSTVNDTILSAKSHEKLVDEVAQLTSNLTLTKQKLYKYKKRLKEEIDRNELRSKEGSIANSKWDRIILDVQYLESLRQSLQFGLLKFIEIVSNNDCAQILDEQHRGKFENLLAFAHSLLDELQQLNINYQCENCGTIDYNRRSEELLCQNRELIDLTSSLTNEQVRLKNLLASVTNQMKKQTLEAHVVSNANIKAKLLKSESRRKNLVYQKKYLCLLIAEFRSYEDSALQLMNQMGVVPNPISLIKRNPLRRLKSVIRVTMAIWRFKYQAKRWNKIRTHSSSKDQTVDEYKSPVKKVHYSDIVNQTSLPRHTASESSFISHYRQRLDDLINNK